MRMLTKTTAKYSKYLNIESLVDEALSNISSLSSKTSMLVDQLAEAIKCIEKIAPEKYFEHYIHFHKLIYGYRFDENLFDFATAQMENVDGTNGAKWSVNQSNEIASKYGLVPNAIMNEWDILYIMNMYASDLWDKEISDEENIDIIMRATKGFLNDPDAPQQAGRALRFFTKVAMWHPDKK